MTLIDAIAIALTCVAPLVFSALWGWAVLRAFRRLGIIRRIDDWS